VNVHRSALNHGINATDGVYAAQRCSYVSDLDDESPTRQFRLGFDQAGRLLELVVLRFDSGNELLIHAMRARPKYYDLIG
jgi:hypothetical protein